jgi:hypothetical protein
MDTSTLIVVFLLVTAASLASYALSHWSSIRGALGMSWAATSIGTALLLVAAAIVVLTFVFRGPLWRPNLGTEQQMTGRDAASKETSARPLDAHSVPSGAADTSAVTAKPTARSSRNRHSYDDSPTSSDNEPPVVKAATTPSTTKPSSAFLGAFNEGDPWAATRCVTVYNPGSDPTQWKIENDCDLPVGIVVSVVCVKDGQQCVPGRQLIFPAKRQRPITLEEQTVIGESVRHVACFVATAEAVYFIGARSEERATDSWREQFDAARTSDGCLMRIKLNAGHGGNSVP